MTNGPKVNLMLALVKLGYMLESPVYSPVLAFKKAVIICDMRIISRKGSIFIENPQRLHA